MKNNSIQSPTSDKVYKKTDHVGKQPVNNSPYFKFFKTVFNLYTDEEIQREKAKVERKNV